MNTPNSPTHTGPVDHASAADAVLPARAEWRFFVALLLPLASIAQVLLNPAMAGVGALAMWLLIAMVDHFLPGTDSSPAPVAHGAWHVWPLRVYVVLQLALLAAGGYAVAHAQSWLTVLGVAFSVGWICGAQGITFAHELGHSRNKNDRFGGWVLMCSIWYAHFMVEHYRGHHPKAATFEDPASSRRGETMYAFWFRTVYGSLVSGWRLEGQRLVQMKSSWSKSPLLWATVLNIAAAAVLLAFGLQQVLLGWLLTSVISATLLELVNYIEHYGLSRQVVAGKREAFNPMHAWNANNYLTNALLANLQRHSDHHTRAWKPYATLAHSPPPCPQLPTGYAGCILLALIPPLWFRLMDARLDALAAASQGASASAS